MVCMIVGMLSGLAGCGGPAGPEGDAAGGGGGREFEGVITYRLSYVGVNNAAVYGDTMKLYYSNGKLARVYNSKGPQALEKEVVFCDRHMYLAKKLMSDTVLTYDVSLNKVYKAEEITRMPDEIRILGHVCKTIEYRDRHKELGFQMYNSISYSEGFLKVDKRHFKDYNFGHFNEYISEAGVLYLKYEMKFQTPPNGYLSSQIATAVSISEQKVDTSVFQVDTSITTPLKL